MAETTEDMDERNELRVKKTISLADKTEISNDKILEAGEKINVTDFCNNEIKVLKRLNETLSKHKQIDYYIKNNIREKDM